MENKKDKKSTYTTDSYNPYQIGANSEQSRFGRKKKLWR